MARILRNRAFFVSQKRAEPLRNLGFRGIVQLESFEKRRFVLSCNHAIYYS